MKKILVLSTGRAGTTFLYTLLKKTGIKIDIRHQRFGSRFLNIWGNISVLGCRPLIQINASLSKILLKNNAPVIVVDPLLSMFLCNSIKDNDDSETGVIHLVRDPRDFVTSFMNWKSSSLKRTILHNLIPFWQPSPWLTGEVSFSRSVLMSKFEHFCWIWNYKNSFFKKIYSKYENYRLIRFEDLTNRHHAEETLHSICQLIKQPFDNKAVLHDILEEKVNRSPENNFPHWNDWTAHQARIMDYWCSDLMKEFGYGFEADWQSQLTD